MRLKKFHGNLRLSAQICVRFFVLLLSCRFASGAEMKVTDRLSVDGSSLFKSTAVFSGNVGIGTTIPSSKLQVVSSTETAYVITAGTGAAYIFIVSTSGNVGIGTTSPGAALDVNGSIRATGIQNTGGSTILTGIQNVGGANNISVSAAAAASVMDYMEYITTDSARATYVTNSDGVDATGGTITDDGNLKRHTFFTNGTFTVTKAGNIEVLVVGGGGGGASVYGGGGGAGGLVYHPSLAVTPGSYSVTIGQGGAGGSGHGSDGTNSVFGGITANGGGGGGDYNSSAGNNGGSGGGAYSTSHGMATQGGSGGGTGYGNNGGDGDGTGGGGGGGGGAGAVGVNGSGTNGGGAGGAGKLYFGSYYAGGGGGGGYDTLANGGNGGGGNGGQAHYTVVEATPGTANTGGGGGGGGGTGHNGAAGGSGIVIIRYTPCYLLPYSESSIKTQGFYSLKGIAAQTSSLNKTLTRTVSPAIDLSGRTQINFDIRSSTTGSNIRMGMHDSGGTTTEITPNIISSDTWQTATWDISAVTDTSKDAIDQIIITIASAPAANTFYVDNMYASGGRANSDITFTSGSERLRIDSSGNIGIGTTSPSHKLEVSGDTLITGNSTGYNYALDVRTGNTLGRLASFQADYGGGVYNGIFIFSDRTNTVGMVGSGAALQKVGIGGSSGTSLLVDINGNVGIGTTSPNAKFQVAGGDLYAATVGNGIILRSPDGTCYRVTVANGGSFSSASITCP